MKPGPGFIINVCAVNTSPSNKAMLAVNEFQINQQRLGSRGHICTTLSLNMLKSKRFKRAF